MADEPWYHAGLPFTCTHCGDCCTGGPGAVWVTDEEIAALATLRGVSYGAMLLEHTRLVDGRRSLIEHANGDCTFFEGRARSCTVYAARPRQCRTWPFWERHLESPAAWQALQTQCPGASCGNLVPLETIESLRRPDGVSPPGASESAKL